MDWSGPLGKRFKPSFSIEPIAKRRVDFVGYSRGKQSAGEAPGEDRHSEQLPRDDVDRAADGERHVDARFTEVERDLAARGAKADNQHPFPGERGGIAITA
jgi:hypothetical protein